MVAIIESIKDTYTYIYDNYADERTKDWYMVKSPMPTVYLITAYLIFVKFIGPRMMENRKPYELKTVMIFYNAIQSFCALYLFLKGGIYGWFTRYNLRCTPFADHIHHPDDEVYLSLAYGFFFIRFFEFTDTVIFILRKKFNQVSVLHVVHHAIVPLIFWMGVLVAPTGHYTFAAWLNAGVHFFMYTYYMLAAMGPKYRKYTWWKIYMTKMQLVQFMMVIVHTVNSLVSDCEIPKLFGYVLIFQAILFLVLFYNYYQQNFFEKKKSASKSNGTAATLLDRLRNNYSAFFEMCIPNQNTLFDDDEVIKNDFCNPANLGLSKQD